VNRLGLRGPDVRLEDAGLKILCVGGSTTECLYITDEKSWPWRLEDKLTESLGRPVFVGNAGRSGHFTLHHDYLLRHYAPVAKFDWVVVLCGINDMGPLLRDNYEDRRRDVPHETLIGWSPIYYRNLAICRAISRLWEMRKSEKIESVVEDAGGAWIAEDRQKRRRALQARTISALPAKMDEAIARYSRDLRRVIAACRQRGVKLVMMTQPTLWTEKMPPELEALLLIHSPDGAYTPGTLSRMMERYNQALRDVCSVDKVDCIDLARLLAKDTSVFYDDCHFNVEGCETVATIVARFFDSKLGSRGG
jgi:lysophospholipase L1-like esterase